MSSTRYIDKPHGHSTRSRSDLGRGVGSSAYSGTATQRPSSNSHPPAALDPAGRADDRPARARADALRERLGRDDAGADVDVRRMPGVPMRALTHGRRKAFGRIPDDQLPGLRLDGPRPARRWRPARRSGAPGRAATGGSSSAAGPRAAPRGVSSQPDDRQLAPGPRGPRAAAARSAPIASSSLMHSRPVGGSGPSSSAPAAASPWARSLSCTSRPTVDAVALEPPARDAVRGRRRAAAAGRRGPASENGRLSTASRVWPERAQVRPRRPRPPRARRSPRADGPPAADRSARRPAAAGAAPPRRADARRARE